MQSKRRPLNLCTARPAVVIFPVLARRGEKPRTILVCQYRPPVAATTIELPAGLIDAGETAEEAAVRELKEETGFVARRCFPVGALMANAPELTADTMRFVVGFDLIRCC